MTQRFPTRSTSWGCLSFFNNAIRVFSKLGLRPTLFLVLRPIFSLADLWTVCALLTGCTYSQFLAHWSDTTAQTVLLGLFGVPGYSQSRGGNPLSFKWPACLISLTLQPARLPTAASVTMGTVLNIILVTAIFSDGNTVRNNSGGGQRFGNGCCNWGAAACSCTAGGNEDCPGVGDGCRIDSLICVTSALRVFNNAMSERSSLSSLRLVVLCLSCLGSALCSSSLWFAHLTELNAQWLAVVALPAFFYSVSQSHLPRRHSTSQEAVQHYKLAAAGIVGGNF